MKIGLNNKINNYQNILAANPANNTKTQPARIDLPLNYQIHDNYGKFIAFQGKVTSADNKDNPIPSRVTALRSEIKKEGLDALMVASTDDYLDEMVDKKQSQRVYMSGFDGSAGEVVISPNDARLIVDSRYHIQADQQVDPNIYKVEKVGLDKNGKKIPEGISQRMLKVLKQLAAKNPDKELKVGYDPNKISTYLLKDMENKLKNTKIKLIPTSENLVDRIWQDKPTEKPVSVNEIPLEYTGKSSKDKLHELREKLSSKKIDGMVVGDLGNIAYLTNLRGKDVDCSAIFKSKALITQDKAVIFCDPEKIPQDIVNKNKGVIEFKPENEFPKVLEETVNSINNPNMAISTDTINYAAYNNLENLLKNKGKLTELDNDPVTEIRSVKTPAEMRAYQNSIAKTDKAVNEVMEWITDNVGKGKTVTEKDLEKKMEKSHYDYGATDLSFEIIPAVGSNSAIIHYSKADPKKVIKPNDFVLVDTGAYYKSGLATDLTRTWIAGGAKAEPSKEQKEIYTTVLKGSLRGLYADLKPGTTGADLDKIVRDPIDKTPYGNTFMHGTGHGVGVVVHEAPYISSGGTTPLKENQIFSIEPGIYLKDKGGVRFENLVTVVKHTDPEKASKGWHQIKCLSHAPVDHNLIDESLLTKQEKKWLEDFDNKSKEAVKEDK